MERNTYLLALCLAGVEYGGYGWHGRDAMQEEPSVLSVAGTDLALSLFMVFLRCRSAGLRVAARGRGLGGVPWWAGV